MYDPTYSYIMYSEVSDFINCTPELLELTDTETYNSYGTTLYCPDFNKLQNKTLMDGASEGHSE